MEIFEPPFDFTVHWLPVLEDKGEEVATESFVRSVNMMGKSPLGDNFSEAAQLYSYIYNGYIGLRTVAGEPPNLH